MSEATRNLLDEMHDEMTKQKRREFWAGAIALPLTFALVPLLMLWNGFAIAKLWLWFGQPVFGLHLSTFHAAGLVLFARLLCIPTHGFTPQYKGMAAFFAAISTPAIALGLGAFWYWLGWGL